MIELPDGLHGAYRRERVQCLLGYPGTRKLVRQHRLVPYGRNVLLDATKAADPWTRAAAAQLLANERGVLCRHSAAWLHGCGAAWPETVHLLVSYDHHLRSRPGLAVHQGDIPNGDTVALAGLRVQVLDAAIADLLCVAPPRTALACLDQALAAAGTGGGEFRERVGRRLRRRGDRRGVQLAEGLLALATGAAEAVPPSWLMFALVSAGFPRPVTRHEILGLDGRVVHRLDLAWVELRIALEYGRHQAFVHGAAAGAAREDDLRRRGWIVLRANSTDLPALAHLLDRLRGVFAQRLKDVAARPRPEPPTGQLAGRQWPTHRLPTAG